MNRAVFALKKSKRAWIKEVGVSLRTVIGELGQPTVSPMNQSSRLYCHLLDEKCQPKVNLAINQSHLTHSIPGGLTKHTVVPNQAKRQRERGL